MLVASSNCQVLIKLSSTMRWSTLWFCNILTRLFVSWLQRYLKKMGGGQERGDIDRPSRTGCRPETSIFLCSSTMAGCCRRLPWQCPSEVDKPGAGCWLARCPRDADIGRLLASGSISVPTCADAAVGAWRLAAAAGLLFCAAALEWIHLRWRFARLHLFSSASPVCCLSAVVNCFYWDSFSLLMLQHERMLLMMYYIMRTKERVSMTRRFSVEGPVVDSEDVHRIK